MITSSKVRTAIRSIRSNLNGFENQVELAQCRKLTQLLKPIRVKSFSIENLKASMDASNFTADFTSKVICQLTMKGSTECER